MEKGGNTEETREGEERQGSWGELREEFGYNEECPSLTTGGQAIGVRGRCCMLQGTVKRSEAQESTPLWERHG